jgi:hypothetical protein
LNFLVDEIEFCCSASFAKALLSEQVTSNTEAPAELLSFYRLAKDRLAKAS